MDFDSFFLSQLHKKKIFTIENLQFSEEEIKKELNSLKVFRKGPFLINQIYIDSQWNSFIKWKYLFKVLEFHRQDFKNFEKNLKILDIGSNNGYYSFLIYYYFKKLGYTPLIDLLDPTEDFYLQFCFLKKFFPEEDQIRWNYIKKGWQEIPTFGKTYDLILCMGVLYHNRNPLNLLEIIHNHLNKKGILILETITIKHGKHPIFLIPEKKYAASKGIWFIPNKKAILTILQRMNFRNINFHSERFIINEMKKIEYLPSLNEVVIKNHTIEGYPKPYRSFFSSIK